MPPEKPVVLLHIGAPKTGTTFLQQLMVAHKDALAEAGYLFPGDTWVAQVRAAQDLLGDTQDPRIEQAAHGAWSAVADAMLAWEGRASILSMEWLCMAGPRQAARAMSSLEGATVHVVLTVRDAASTLPAQWQTMAHNQGRESWPEFVESAMSDSLARRRWVGWWRHRRTRSDFGAYQDVPRMLRTWGRLVPVDRLHVVTVPQASSDPMLLWRRFAQVVGIDPRVCTEPTSRTNASLGQASAELVRRLNVTLGEVAHSDYVPTVKEYLALTVLAARSESEQRARLDVAALEFAVDWNRGVREAVQASGAHVVGDLEDLPVRVPESAATTAAPRLTDPPDDEVLAAAATAVDGMRALLRRRARRLHRAGGPAPRELERYLREDSPTRADSWDRDPDPVQAAVDELATMTRLAIDLRTQVRRAGGR